MKQTVVLFPLASEPKEKKIDNIFKEVRTMSKKLSLLILFALLVPLFVSSVAFAPPPAPGKATNPSPPDQATGVSITADLSWSAGPRANSHDVYFGTTSPGDFQGNQAATTFDPGTMDNDETYFWRIDEIGGGGTTTGDVWSFTTESAGGPPGQASNPDPADTATDVSITIDLSWTAGSEATSHDVYFGTSSPGSFQGNQTETTFDPATLNNDETYFWRIDELNTYGTTTGTVWSFTTESAPTPPGQATNPNPADTETDVSTTADLSWTAGSGATSHDVHFGTSSPGSFQGNQTDTTYDPGTMDASTQHFWRIDEVNAAGTTTGTVWSFTTGAGGGDIEDMANSDIAVAGSVSGSYTDTQSSNNVYESIQEIESGGAPPKRYSYLEHKWTINVTGGSSVTFYVEAYHTSNSEGDDFVFAYSTNDSDYYNMVTVTKTSDDDATQSYEMPSSTSGTVYIRVQDTDRSQGNKTLDTVYVDYMYILSVPETNPPGQASNPSPPNTQSDVSLNADLSWTDGSGATSHDVYFGTSSPGTYKGNQTPTTYDPGTMEPNTPYYWRIDEINAIGTTTGSVWTFTTGSGGEVSMLITSIENSTELAEWTSSGTLSLSTEHVTEGTYSLKAVFGSVTPTLTFDPSSTFDVSGYRKIKFDLYVEGDTMTPTARFFDSSWDSYRSWYYLYNTGFQTVEYAIPGIETLADSSSLIEINIAAGSSLPTGTTIYLDNLRATDGPDDDSWLQNLYQGEPSLEDPNSILINADFELGLHKWGSWGEWDNGQYIFSSATGSGNVKSGIYSMTIICIDLGRGGIWTEEDLTLEATDYDLTFWVKGSDTSAECFYSFEGDDSANFSQGRTCARFAVGTSWTEKSFPVTLTAQSTAKLYLFSTGGGTLYLDAVNLVRSDGQGGPDPNAPPMTPSIVTVSGQNTFVDSNSFFPIGIYGGVPSELGSTGFNLIASVQGGDNLDSLDDCEQYGLMAWVSLNGIARGHMPEQADVAARPLKNHPAVLCWYNCDEPDHQGWNVPPPEIRFMTKELVAEDANHPSGVLNMPWTPSNMYQYADTADILMTDPYDLDVAVVADQVDTQRDAAGQNKPIWIVLRAFGTSEPSTSYLYGCAYAAVTHTANGILWFDYTYCQTHSNTWNTVKAISLELEDLSDALVSNTSSLEVTVSDPDVDTILKEYNGNLYLIAVNIGSSSSGVELTISGVTATQADVWFESRTEPIVSGTITDDFAADGRHVYVFTAP